MTGSVAGCDHASIRWAVFVTSRSGGLTADGDLDGVRLHGETITDVAADGVRLLDCELSACTLSGTDLARSTWRDTRLAAVRLVGVQLIRSRWTGVDVAESSLAGCDLSSAQLRRLTLTGCRLDAVNLRASVWEDVTLVECRLRDVDLAQARLSGVRFVRCTLERVDLTRAELHEVDLRSSTVELSRGWDRLRGAIVDPAQLMQLAPALAAALGIRVESS